ncbi:PH domain-containing protein, partial [Candidatus Protofrankia californiensis]|uniref:PH domain-containing protein n=1 Tax=Candidatus Protofrankia californiensis TaxID=1839754 RepID=UPI003D3263D6
THRSTGAGASGAGLTDDGTGGESGPRSWSPSWWRVAVYAVGGAFVLAVSAVDSLAARWESLDRPGRLLIGIAGVGLLLLAGRDALARPTLRVDQGGVDLVDGIHRRHLPWAAVLRVHAGTLTHNRRGVHVRVLTVETIDGPILLSRRQLGAEPDRIAETVEEIRLHLR